MLPMKKIHQRRKEMFSREEGEVIFTPKYHIFTTKYHISMQIGILQEGQLVQKFRKVTNMTRALKNLISTHTQEYPTLHMREIHKVKAEIPTFNGNVDIEGCLDWLYEVETFSRRPLSFFGCIQVERSRCMVALPSRRSQAKRRTSCEILAADEESFEREIFAYFRIVLKKRRPF
jgi:hypothetical protein